jgi:hypothetical protein
MAQSCRTPQAANHTSPETTGIDMDRQRAERAHRISAYTSPAEAQIETAMRSSRQSARTVATATTRVHIVGQAAGAFWRGVGR